MPTRDLNFDTLSTYDSHRYSAVTHLSLSRYSNTEYVKNKNSNRSKHSHSNLEHVSQKKKKKNLEHEGHEEHIQKSEKLQKVEPKHISNNPNTYM